MAAPTGNQNASKKQRWISDALRRKFTQDPLLADKLAQKMIDDGLAGNLLALRELLDRTEGKVPQGIIGGDEDDPSIKHNHIVEFLGAPPTTSKV